MDVLTLLIALLGVNVCDLGFSTNRRDLSTPATNGRPQ